MLGDEQHTPTPLSTRTLPDMNYNPPSPSSFEITIPTRGEALPGTLSLPSEPVGTVIFAHGSGSGRGSPRNLAVAEILNASHIATVLFDLLTPQEAAIEANRFDIDLLTWRLVRAVEWVSDSPIVPELPVGLFGASTGAAAALKASALLGKTVTAVVSRGGRPDLAGNALSQVRAPSLFIVGGNDPEVERLNRKAMDKMQGERQICIIPEASHLFEEGRSLETVAGLAAGWFLRYFQERTEGTRSRRTPRPEAHSH